MDWTRTTVLNAATARKRVAKINPAAVYERNVGHPRVSYDFGCMIQIQPQLPLQLRLRLCLRLKPPLCIGFKLGLHVRLWIVPLRGGLRKCAI